MPSSALLQLIGGRLRARRRELALSQAQLATRASVSRRFLVQLERGEGNATLGRLADVSRALSLPLEALFRDAESSAAQSIALVGLRGAGKSTVGHAVAARLNVEFVELDEVIVRDANMSLADIFEFHGPAFYRQVEAEAVEHVFATDGPRVVAVGGSLVTAEATWTRLRQLALTVWLRASPRSHFERVTAQGDLRPMVGRPDALEELKAILAERAPLYAMADLELDTDDSDVEVLVEAIRSARAERN